MSAAIYQKEGILYVVFEESTPFDGTVFSVIDRVRKIVDEGDWRKVLIDCSNITSVISAGLGKIVFLNLVLEGKGGMLVLCCVRQDVYDEVFDITRLSKRLNITLTMADAEALLKAHRISNVPCHLRC